MTFGPNYPANLAHLVDKPHAVYVIWRGDEPLYVGMTSNWQARTDDHLRTYFQRARPEDRATHIDVWLAAESRWDAEQLERQTIRDLDPRDNCEHSPTRNRRRAEWLWYSAWTQALGRSFSRDYAWAQEPWAHARALEILNDHGYSLETAVKYGMFPESTGAAA